VSDDVIRQQSHHLRDARPADALPAGEGGPAIEGFRGQESPPDQGPAEEDGRGRAVVTPRASWESESSGATTREDGTTGGAPMKDVSHFGALLPPEGPSRVRIALAGQGQVP
jgi:hypothetical protein